MGREEGEYTGASCRRGAVATSTRRWWQTGRGASAAACGARGGGGSYTGRGNQCIYHNRSC
uniref:Uncharacterized protein n=1 Tax=Oryza rufipogon TaxID=4529 RepID=A0A0E0P871_ORYRU